MYYYFLLFVQRIVFADIMPPERMRHQDDYIDDEGIKVIPFKKRDVQGVPQKITPCFGGL